MKHTTRHSRQRGAALVIGLILLAIITLLAVVGMNVANSELMQATTEQLRLRAFQAAETGLEFAVVHDMFEVPAATNAKKVYGPTGVSGSPINPDDSKPMDTYTTTIEFRGENQPPSGFGPAFSAFHYSIVSEGGSIRNSKATHEQGAYIVNATGGQQPYAPL
jgi:hypothetical protein